MEMTIVQYILFVFCLSAVFSDDSYASRKYKVPCFEKYIPKNCNYTNVTLDAIKSVEDFDRCAPAVIEIKARNLFWGATGLQDTYLRNFRSLKKITIVRRKLFGKISNNSIAISLLGNNVSMPIGVSPTAAHKLVNPGGEIASAKAAVSQGVVYTLSALAQTRLEKVAEAAFSVNKNAVLWMQTYFLSNKSLFRKFLHRIEKARFKGILLTLDKPLFLSLSCGASTIYPNVSSPNSNYLLNKMDVTFKDLKWLVATSKLPVVAKGIMSVESALQAAKAGVPAIMVSNQGGRVIDGEQSTVEVLDDIVRNVRIHYPHVEIYIDGGIRSGPDVFKVLALGAKAAFVGRPVVWGLAIDGQRGVERVFQIMGREFNSTMLFSGFRRPCDITRKAVSLPNENPGW